MRAKSEAFFDAILQAGMVGGSKDEELQDRIAKCCKLANLVYEEQLGKCETFAVKRNFYPLRLE